LNNIIREINPNLIRIFDEIKEKGNFSGVLFAYRDGELISQNFGDQLSSKKFTSMCASVLEGATDLGKAIGDRKLNKIIAEAEEYTILIIECDNKSFLAFVVNEDSKVEQILSQIQKYIQEIKDLY